MLDDHLLGIYEKAVPPALSWPERFQLAKKLGFDFVKISIHETDERLSRLYWNKAEKRGEPAIIKDHLLRWKE